MAEAILIYGKAGWPHTEAARADYAKKGNDVRYIDVQNDAEGMQQMLEAAKGRREVPVIVEGGRVTIGYGGTW